MSLIKQLTEEQIFTDYSDEDIIKKLKDNGIEVGEELDYYIGSGVMGDVYKVKDTNKVIKIYEGADEFNAIEKIKEYQSTNKTDHVVKYYFNKKLENENICVMEYLEPLKSAEYPSKFVSRVIKNMEKNYLGNVQDNIDGDTVVSKLILRGIPDGHHDDLLEIFSQIKNNFKSEQDLYDVFVASVYAVVGTMNTEILESVLKFVEKNKKLFIHIFRGVREIKKMGTQHGDIHGNNILKDPKTGDYKLIDPYPNKL